MEYVIAICGFIGGWLLVAGPVWQAAIELHEEEIDREAIEAVRSATPLPRRMSKWWWLLPPVAYVKQFRQSKAARQAFQDALTPEQLEQAVNFFNKANGWLIVGIGGLLIAAKETWELITLLDWPVWVFWVLVVVMTVLAIANAVVRIVNTRNTLNSVQSPAKRR